MDCVGGYYGEAFKVFRDVTKGDPLYPTIFDVVVDVVVHHWVFLVVGIMGGLYGWWGGGGGLLRRLLLRGRRPSCVHHPWVASGGV